ncbi:spore maturation protein CgeB [Sphingobium xenophagum]|uniref:Spore maturation protein CgeB n=1 Tax=Sphingobium xenophagum TaxID=121428 RepID=A0ABU1X287_SPHXE|nr:glycosyltransferase [Sphingobium xenophagum]MDR7155673.1 spore maturation protein CgeB [Sphingobium xenophagum]
MTKLRIIFSTSLFESKLNEHIYKEIAAVLRETCIVDVFHPDRLIQRPDFSGYDLLLYLGSSISEHVPLNTMAAMAKIAGIPSVFWATDDPYEFDARYRANDFDVYFSNDRNAAAHFLERSHVYHLPLAAAKSDFRPVTPLDTRQLGMFFCGYPYNNRKRIISDLLSYPRFSRNDLVVMGPSWDIVGLQNLAGDSSHDQVIDYYSAVQLVLNIGRTYDISNDYRKLVATTPGPRTFECALAGTPQIYFINSLEIEDYYVRDREMILVESVEEAVERFRWIRDHPEAWLDMAQAAQARTQRDHLYANRIRSIFDRLSDIGILTKEESGIGAQLRRRLHNLTGA